MLIHGAEPVVYLLPFLKGVLVLEHIEFLRQDGARLVVRVAYVQLHAWVFVPVRVDEHDEVAMILALGDAFQKMDALLSEV